MEFLDQNVPDSSVRRLSAYLRQLERLVADGAKSVSSQQLAECMKVGAAQVRRDIALFGQFGRRGVGYDPADLINQIRRILGTAASWNVVVMGAGPLSHALLRYPGFSQRGFQIVAAFDIDPGKIDQTVGDIPVRRMEDLESVVAEFGVRLAILAVPPEAAQDAADRLAAAGIEGILNFATTGLDAPPSVYTNQVDITAGLEQLSFQVSNNRP